MSNYYFIRKSANSIILIMKISGFTIARNAISFNYPILESIQSILPICDEFIVNLGDSDDDTLQLIKSIHNPKIRIIESKWDFSKGPEVLSQQTNLALKECRGDWAFYLQSDEVVHENDLPRLKKLMQNNLDANVDALRFKWFHFYGSYYRYRIDKGWYQKQDRIIRNNGLIESLGDAWGFQRKDGNLLQRKNTNCFIYHYGWVQPQEVMAQRRINAERIGFITLEQEERKEAFLYGDLRKFPVYFGSHPRTMKVFVQSHERSKEDKKVIDKEYWWHPWKICQSRAKTWRRVKEKIV